MNPQNKVIELIRAQLEMMQAQCVAMSDPAWIHQQTAADMGNLYGVAYDQLLNVAARIDGNQEPNQP